MTLDTCMPRSCSESIGRFRASTLGCLSISCHSPSIKLDPSREFPLSLPNNKDGSKNGIPLKPKLSNRAGLQPCTLTGRHTSGARSCHLLTLYTRTRRFRFPKEDPLDLRPPWPGNAPETCVPRKSLLPLQKTRIDGQLPPWWRLTPLLFLWISFVMTI